MNGLEALASAQTPKPKPSRSGGLLGIVLLDDDGRPLASNEVAREFAERADAFTLDDDGLVALRASDGRRIAAALDALRSAEPGRVLGLGLPRRNGKPDYLLQLRRLPAGSAAALRPAPALELRILDPEVSAMPGIELLQQLFGLTATQARLAQCLSSGARHADAASALGIGVATVRTHLTEIYRKTRTSSTAQLIRVLALLVVLLDSDLQAPSANSRAP